MTIGYGADNRLKTNIAYLRVIFGLGVVTMGNPGKEKS